MNEFLKFQNCHHHYILFPYQFVDFKCLPTLNYVVCAAAESRLIQKHGLSSTNILIWKKNNQPQAGEINTEDELFYYRAFKVGPVDPIGAFDIENYFNDTFTHIGYRKGNIGIKIGVLNKEHIFTFDRNVLY